MKLASLKHGRDGRLVIVSSDLNWFTDAFLIAPTLQAALDDWERCEPLLRALALSARRFNDHWSKSGLRVRELRAARAALAQRPPMDGAKGSDSRVWDRH